MKKTVLITGGNSGIGLSIAREMARRGARVCLACRDQVKAAAAIKSILAETPDADIELYAIDLASFASIKSFATEFLARHPSFDALVNNAGAYPTSQRITEDGFELQFGGNHLGPFLLTHLLLPALQSADDGRIVNMASIAHMAGKIDFSSFHGRKRYVAFAAYAQSKLCNMLFNKALATRLEGSGVTTNAVHPGGVDSPLYRELPKAVYAMFRLFLIGPEKAAQLTADLALAPKYHGVSGKYFSAQGPAWVSANARNAALADRLYAESCKLTGIAELTHISTASQAA